ncbi:ABC transporter permease [Oceanimonas sp. GK1]|uniref:ABC transporter permease n=1 Tax=Oceanimonas sp. (strain GK1 / IBRC-M 10197) TaxID=511062 RepID=UPI0002494BB2|nr:ABC transporter permease [Oceanimonas sp. GK1]AEX99832.1 ABC transporter permease [Oceanimonas sp. GK1]
MTLPNTDKVGGLLALALVASLLALPFVGLQPNRILPGEALGLLTAAGTLGLWPLLLLPLCLVNLGLRLRLLLTALALPLLVATAGHTATALLSDAGPLARVSLGAGFWLGLFWLCLLITDTALRLKLGPLARLALVAAVTSTVFALLASGLCDNLSLLKEFHHRSDFWRQGLRHLQLALGSIIPAVLAGIPLGMACHRSPALRAALFPVLNILQTVPSLAMFGLLMVPLSLLASAHPWLGELGIRGIGAAPAVIALFLYSLLPIVSNTALGFDRVDARVREAATAMGMSRRQRLWQVEFPLALPVILSGLRVVVTLNIGLVAVAALVGGGGYGTYIFQGLGQTATDLVILGALPTLLLAFLFATLIDTLIALQQGRHP